PPRAPEYRVRFPLSPVVWRKVPGARSAGRVQSVALRLVCDREGEIEAFKPREYWSVEVTLEPPNGGACPPRRRRPPPAPPPPPPLPGVRERGSPRLDIPDEATARRIEAALKSGAYRVTA